MSAYLTDPVLEGVYHGFATRSAVPPDDYVRPHQIHGAAVVEGAACRDASEPPDADAIVSTLPGLTVAVVTADCVPVLLAVPSGAAVAAVHAGWRGLAAGVVTTGVEALVRASGATAPSLVAAIGPHIGPCCYEVDEPVLEALEDRHGRAVRVAARPARPGHTYLDLGGLVRTALVEAGLEGAGVGGAAGLCTFCNAERFHSYRRDGSQAGRLLHYVTASGNAGGQG